MWIISFQSECGNSLTFASWYANNFWSDHIVNVCFRNEFLCFTIALKSLFSIHIFFFLYFEPKESWLCWKWNHFSKQAIVPSLENRIKHRFAIITVLNSLSFIDCDIISCRHLFSAFKKKSLILIAISPFIDSFRHIDECEQRHQRKLKLM